MVMLGPEGVARGVTKRLRERMHLALADQRAATGASVAELPDPNPKNIHPYEVDIVSIGSYPAMMVTVRDSGGRGAPVRYAETGIGHDEYQFRYRVRVYFYVNGTDYGPTALMRLRTIAAIRAVILSDRSLVVAPDGQSAAIDTLTYTEELEGGIGGVETDAGEKLIGSGAVSFEVTTSERIEYVTTEIEVTSSVDNELPKHPAAD